MSASQCAASAQGWQGGSSDASGIHTDKQCMPVCCCGTRLLQSTPPQPSLPLYFPRSIAFFNAFGVAITKYMNASTRMVIDSLRTMVIWAFSLGVGWESFCWVQTIGFALLLAGSMIYNQVVRVPGFAYPDAPAKGAALLEDEGDEYDGGYAPSGGTVFGGTSYSKLEADI